MQQTPYTRSKKFLAGCLVAVAVVAVYLATDFAARPSRAVNVYVSGAGTNRVHQFIKFSGGNSALVREVSDVYRRDGAGDLCWGRRTRLRSRRTVAEVGAKEHADGTSHRFLSKVNMSLLDSAFEVFVSQLPLDARFILADARVESSITGGRDC